ncbi:hypothetical protein DPMN_020689 [Dreissena polymorpha]|uniref:Uncharacterized protein n=1 Tax=Dreissena polymorpha TaxID=45954 RepID=A0A9D4NH82_DREPO|nr:hypothetical protein DPMN_020689 [Dreissena polymorpha]
MARQRPTRIPKPHIDRIVIREVQYQLEVNGCRNEEIIVKDNFGWVWPIMGGAPQVEIDRIVIRDVQYQEVNRCRNEDIIVKGNFGWAWRYVGGAPQVEIDCIVIKEVQYQFEVNGLKGNFGWARLVAEIDRIVIREVQYQFEVNRCRNEEIIVKANLGGRGLCGRGAPWLVMGPCIVEIDRIVIREAQYQFEVNRCRNEEVSFQGSSANSVGGAGGQDTRTDAHHHNIPTFSPWG